MDLIKAVDLELLINDKNKRESILRDNLALFLRSVLVNLDLGLIDNGR